MLITTTKKLNEVQAKLDKALVELADAQELNITLQTKVDTQTKEIEQLKADAQVTPELHQQVKEALVETLAELEKSEEAKTQAQAKADALEVNQEDIEHQIAEKALELTAAQGVPPIDLKPSINPAAEAPEGDLVTQLNSIKDSAKQRAFWLANKEALMPLLFKTKK
jgi:chromosome segregation ATPase